MTVRYYTVVSNVVTLYEEKYNRLFWIDSENTVTYTANAAAVSYTLPATLTLSATSVNWRANLNYPTTFAPVTYASEKGSKIRFKFSSGGLTALTSQANNAIPTIAIKLATGACGSGGTTLNKLWYNSKTVSVVF